MRDFQDPAARSISGCSPAGFALGDCLSAALPFASAAPVLPLLEQPLSRRPVTAAATARGVLPYALRRAQAVVRGWAGLR